MKIKPIKFNIFSKYIIDYSNNKNKLLNNISISLFCDYKRLPKKVLVRGKLYEEKGSNTPNLNLKELYKNQIKDYSKPLNDKHNIVYHAKESDNKLMEKLVNKMLNEDMVTSEESEQFKKEVRSYHYGLRFDKLHKMNDIDYGNTLNSNPMDETLAVYANNKYKDLYFYSQEQKKYLNPIFSEIDKLNRPMPSNYNYIEELKSKYKWIPHKEHISPNIEYSKEVKENKKNKKQNRFDINYNYNYEQYKTFTKEHKKAKVIDQNKTDYNNKLLMYVKNNPNSKFTKRYIKNSLLPYELISFPTSKENIDSSNIIDFEVPKKDYEIRKREEKNSSDITNYDCWRSFTTDVPYLLNYHDNSRRIRLVPSKLIKRFGKPSPHKEEDMTGCYFFEDSNLDSFILFDWKQTTITWGKNLPDSEYDNQENIMPLHRIRKFPSLEEFWSSNEHQEFRYNFSRYAERRKFLKWILKEVDGEEVNSLEKELNDKFGVIDKYESLTKVGRTENRVPSIYEYSQEYITGKQTSSFNFPRIFPPKAISLNEPGAELFDNNFYVKQKALQGLQRSNTEDDLNNEENNDNEISISDIFKKL